MRFAVLFCSLVLTGIVFGQDKFPSPTGQIEPTYPAVAKAVRASGIVTVQVHVDSAGKAKSSAATGGHPLPRKAAENAAAGWEFAPLSGNHYLQVVFVFTPGKVGGKDRTRIRGPYKLELIVGLPIVQQWASEKG